MGSELKNAISLFEGNNSDLQIPAETSETLEKLKTAIENSQNSLNTHNFFCQFIVILNQVFGQSFFGLFFIFTQDQNINIELSNKKLDQFLLDLEKLKSFLKELKNCPEDQKKTKITDFLAQQENIFSTSIVLLLQQFFVVEQAPATYEKKIKLKILIKWLQIHQQFQQKLDNPERQIAPQSSVPQSTKPTQQKTTWGSFFSQAVTKVGNTVKKVDSWVESKIDTVVGTTNNQFSSVLRTADEKTVQFREKEKQVLQEISEIFGIVAEVCAPKTIFSEVKNENNVSSVVALDVQTSSLGIVPDPITMVFNDSEMGESEQDDQSPPSQVRITPFYQTEIENSNITVDQPAIELSGETDAQNSQKFATEDEVLVELHKDKKLPAVEKYQDVVGEELFELETPSQNFTKSVVDKSASNPNKKARTEVQTKEQLLYGDPESSDIDKPADKTSSNTELTLSPVILTPAPNLQDADDNSSCKNNNTENSQSIAVVSSVLCKPNNINQREERTTLKSVKESVDVTVFVEELHLSENDLSENNNEEDEKPKSFKKYKDIMDFVEESYIPSVVDSQNDFNAGDFSDEEGLMSEVSPKALSKESISDHENIISNPEQNFQIWIQNMFARDLQDLQCLEELKNSIQFPNIDRKLCKFNKSGAVDKLEQELKKKPAKKTQVVSSFLQIVAVYQQQGGIINFFLLILNIPIQIFFGQSVEDFEKAEENKSGWEKFKNFFSTGPGWKERLKKRFSEVIEKTAQCLNFSEQTTKVCLITYITIFFLLPIFANLLLIISIFFALNITLPSVIFYLSVPFYLSLFFYCLKSIFPPEVVLDYDLENFLAQLKIIEEKDQKLLQFLGSFFWTAEQKDFEKEIKIFLDSRVVVWSQQCGCDTSEIKKNELLKKVFAEQKDEMHRKLLEIYNSQAKEEKYIPVSAIKSQDEFFASQSNSENLTATQTNPGFHVDTEPAMV